MNCKGRFQKVARNRSGRTHEGRTAQAEYRLHALPYPFKYGVYQSGRWTKYLIAIEKDRKPYLEGKQSFDEAVKSLVRDL
jgi:hypothetical protein